MKNEKGQSILVLIAAIALIGGGIYLFMQPAIPGLPGTPGESPQVASLPSGSACTNIASNMVDGVYVGPPIGDATACCVDASGNLVSCSTGQSFAMLVGTSTTPFDAITFFASVKNTGTIPMNVYIKSVQVTGDSATASAIMPSFVQGTALNSNIAGLGANTQVYKDQAVVLQPTYQVIWGTIIKLDGTSPNNIVPPGAASVAIEMCAKDPSGKLTESCKTRTTDLALGEAKIEFDFTVSSGAT